MMLRWAFSICLLCVGTFAVVASFTPSAPVAQPVQFIHKLHVDHLRDGSEAGHRRMMVAKHKTLILKQLQDEKLVADMMGMVKQGNCTLCHGDFEKNGDLEALGRCAGCHRPLLEHDRQGREDYLPCMGCHATALQSPQASIPKAGTCAACHLPPVGSSSEEAKLVEFLTQGTPIPWVRVNDYLPGNIIFSHERHVELGRVKCQECHGPVDLAEQPLSLDVKLSMEDCVSCHEETGADNDCLACHK